MGTLLQVVVCVLMAGAFAQPPSPSPGVRNKRPGGTTCFTCGNPTRVNAGQRYCPTCDHICTREERQP